MSLMTLLRSERRRSLTTYRDLLERSLRGEEIGQDEALLILSAAGKALADVERDAQVLRERLRQAAILDDALKAREEWTDAATRIDALQQELQRELCRVTHLYTTKIEAVDRTLVEARQRAFLQGGAEQQLLDTAAALYPELVEREEQLAARGQRAAAALRGLEERRSRLRLLLNSAAADDPRVPEAKEKLAEVQALIPAAETEMLDVTREREELRAAKLRP